MRVTGGYFCCAAVACLIMYHSVRFYMKDLNQNMAYEERIVYVNSNGHPYGVIGIFTKAEQAAERNLYRRVFSSVKFNNVLVRFLLDSRTEETESEATIQNDIVFLNMADSGKEVQFGEKLLKWFSLSMEMFPDAKFVGKMDINVYICDATFQFVWEHWSPLMYLGWAHNIGWNNRADINRMDNMFIVVGNELVHRVVKTQACANLEQCGISRHLYDEKFDDVSLAVFLSEYDDVNVVPINDIATNKKDLTYVPGMCNKYVLLHSIESAETMDTIYQGQNSKQDIAPDKHVFTAGVSGNVFKGTKNRVYNGQRLNLTVSPFKWRDNETCSFWGVVTTIHAFTTAVEKAMDQMCVVIVSDKKTPEDTYENLTSRYTVRLLNIQMQEELSKQGLEIIRDIPWNHFGRKNIGFLYAIMHGAKKIFDFDDDNILVRDVIIKNEWFLAPEVKAFNPCPSYIKLDDVTWPRGFPLSEILNTNSWANISQMEKTTIDESKIGIIQSLADYDPDVDAIWRLTRKLPMFFESNNIQVLLRHRTFSPCNAQALLHYALWDTLLPISVPGRVTDIWRCYIAQRLMMDVGQSLGFVSPLVKQIRNSHDYKADFNGELPLYEQTEALIDFLLSWKSSAKLFEERMFELYVSLYEREYIEFDDVTLVKSWLRSLKQIDFQFPAII